ncbi:MAG: HAD-IA family hydrolase [Pseudomonadota bacterium]
MSAAVDDLFLVIFDVDGTLIDSEAHILLAMEAAFGASDRPMPERSAALSVIGLSLPLALAELAPGSSAYQLAEMEAAYRAAFQAARLTDGARLSPLFPGARAVLNAIDARETWLAGIATGKSARGLEAILKIHDLHGRFVTQQVADHHPSKPHPSMLEKALAETGVARDRAIMVGDTRYDMEMARAAGISAIGVTWGHHAPDELRRTGAREVISSFHDLLPILDERWT